MANLYEIGRAELGIPSSRFEMLSLLGYHPEQDERGIRIPVALPDTEGGWVWAKVEGDNAVILRNGGFTPKQKEFLSGTPILQPPSWAINLAVAVCELKDDIADLRRVILLGGKQ